MRAPFFAAGLSCLAPAPALAQLCQQGFVHIPLTNQQGEAVAVGESLWIATLLGGVVEWNTTTGERRSYTRGRHCLPSDRVHSITVDTGGNVWVATHEGAAFKPAGSGYETPWIPVALPVPPGRSDYVTTVEAAPDGSVWMGTYDAGCFRRTPDGAFTRLDPEPHSIAGTFITGMVFEPDGTLWAGVWGGWLYRYEPGDDAWTQFTAASTGTPSGLCFPVQPPEQIGLTSPVLVPIGVDAAGDLWIRCEDDNPNCRLQTTVRFDGTDWHGYSTFNSELPDVHTTGAATGADGVTYVAGWGGVAAFDGADFVPAAAPGAGVQVNAAVRVGEHVWFVAPQSIFRLEDGEPVGFASDGLIGNTVHGIRTDAAPLPFDDGASASAWFASSEGVQRYRDGELTTYTPQNSGLHFPAVRSLAQAADGSLWCGTYGGGIARFDGAAWTVLDENNSGLAGNLVTLIEPNPYTGELWIASDLAGVSVTVDGSSWVRHTPAGSGAALQHVTGFAFAGDGAVWVSSSNGLHRYADGAWRSWTTGDGLPTNVLSGLGVAPDGRVWIGMSGSGGATPDASGVLVFDGERFLRLTPRPEVGPGSNQVFELAVSPSGDVWASIFNGGVCVLHDGRWTHFRENESLLSDRVWSVAPAGDGSVWLGSEGGVSIFTGDLPASPCGPADRDGDGDSDVSDLLAYLGQFRSGDGIADLTADTTVDVNDLLGFLGAFRAGCAGG